MCLPYDEWAIEMIEGHEDRGRLAKTLRKCSLTSWDEWCEWTNEMNMNVDVFFSNGVFQSKILAG